jgi:copper chaperone CopZ
METTLLIDGMRSAHCARAVHTALAMVPGIATAEVVVGRATLEHGEPLDANAISQAVTLAGYSLRECTTLRRRLVLLADDDTVRSPPAAARDAGDDASPDPA